MAKILLVEDDNNLREIYEARLQAEGYEIVSARDGEEALVVAKSEKPDLVISDVMMPKISGFEMLDILRNTDGLKHVKVIMLTALGQSDDQQRADKLGADRYLVKSQVTLEDIVKAAHDLLGDSGAGTPAAGTGAASAPTAAQSDDQVMNDAVNSLIADTNKPDKPGSDQPAKPAKPPTSTNSDDATKDDDTDQTPSVTKKVIKPLDKKPGKDIQTLLAEEEAKENGQTGAAPVSSPAGDTTVAPTQTPVKAEPEAEPEPEVKPAPEQKQEEPVSPGPMSSAPTTAAEEAAVDARIEDFVAGASTDPTPPEPEQPPKPETKPADTPAAPAAPPSAPAPPTPAPNPISQPSPTTPAATPPAPATPDKPADKPPSDPNIIAL